MQINKNKVHSLIKKSVWDYEPFCCNSSDIDHEDVKQLINGFQVPFRHVDYFIDEERDVIRELFEKDNDGEDDINRFAAKYIADEIGQAMTSCKHNVTFKIYLPCTSHF